LKEKENGKADQDTLAAWSVLLPHRSTLGGQMSSYFWTTERHDVTMDHSTLPTFECYSHRALNVS
jgi:hypothetical protein